MEQAADPETALEVSRVALGTWAIGGWMWGGADDAEAIATIRSALEHGVNVIDTAPVYGFGHAEEIVGQALAEAGLRDRALIATKTGVDWRDGKPFRNASRTRIMREIDDWLRRLRTDHIDIYQVHWPDPSTPLEETAEVMHTLFQQGKIRAIGVSNFSVAQIERFRTEAPLHVVQSPYNLFERRIETDILPYCRSNKIATFGYGALCRGLLSGRMRPDTAFVDDDLRHADPKFQATFSGRSTGFPSTASEMPPIGSRLSPVAVTMMSAGSVPPEARRTPSSTKRSILSVTMETRPDLSALKRSPSGRAQRR